MNNAVPGLSAARGAPLREFISDLAIALLCVAALTAAAFCRYPLKTPVLSIPTTMQIALVPLLGALVGHFRAYLAIVIYLLMVMAELPVFAYMAGLVPLAVFTFWWTGIAIGYVCATHWSGRIHEMRFTAGAGRIIRTLIAADLVMIIPHFLWQWSRVNEASIFVLLQMAVGIVLQVVFVFFLKWTFWRGRAVLAAAPAAAGSSEVV